MKTNSSVVLCLISVLFGLALTPSSRAVSNNNFVDARIISSIPYITNSTNTDATREVGEPYHRGSTVGHTVWWSWTAPSSATVVMDTTGSSFDTLLAVYTGSSVSTLILVAENDQAGPGTNTSLVSFSATSGVTYSIAVDGWHGQEGKTTLHVMTSTPQGLTGPCLVSVGGQPHLQFLATPPAGSNIVIQINTNLNNLSSSDWTSLQTNGSAFLFTDPDPATAPQKFYRAKSQ